MGSFKIITKIHQKVNWYGGHARQNCIPYISQFASKTLESNEQVNIRLEKCQ